MRPFETILIIILAINLVQLFLRDTKRREFMLVQKIGWSVLLLNFFIEQFRWQMGPAYFLLFTLYFIGMRKNHFGVKFAVLLLWILSSFLPYAVPVISLPKPTGPYEVGTTIHHWIDTSRLEWFTEEDPDDVREIMVQIWYPAEKKTLRKLAPYIDQLDLRAEAMGKAGGVPPYLLSHIDLTKTNATLGETPRSSAAPFPLIIISHGITGMRQIHTTMAENLASHGYIVIGADHSFDANLTIFPDGRIADYRSDIIGHPDSINIRRNQMNTRVADIQFIINQFHNIENGELKHRLTGLMDLDKIGVMGHSFGGSTAIQASKINREIKACLVLDSWVNPLPQTTILTGIEIPFLYMGRPHWNDSDYPSNYDLLNQLMKNNRGPQFRFTIKGSRHMDYSDAPLFSPFMSLLLDTGTLKGERIIALTNRLALEFFNQILKGMPSRILNRKESVPEFIFH